MKMKNNNSVVGLLFVFLVVGHHGIQARETTQALSEATGAWNLKAKENIDRQVAVAFALLVPGALLAVAQPHISFSSSRVNHRERDCPSEIATRLMGADLLPLEDKRASTALKLCKDDWSYKISPLNMIGFQRLAHSSHGILKLIGSLFLLTYSERHFGGCVPLARLFVSGQGSVCATEVDEEGQATEFGMCFKCDPCMCSPNGFSGQVQTGIHGCDHHFVGDSVAYSKFCYTVGGDACPTATASSRFPSAAFRSCEAHDNHPSLPEDMGSELGSRLSVIGDGSGLKVLPSLISAIAVVLIALSVAYFAVVLSAFGDKTDRLNSDDFTGRTAGIDTSIARLASLNSTEWHCADGTTCREYTQFGSASAFSECSNRFTRLISPHEQNRDFSSNDFLLEFACASSCSSGCTPPAAWTPVQISGSIKTPSVGCFNHLAPCQRLVVSVTDENGGSLSGGEVEVSSSDVKVGGVTVAEVGSLFSPINGETGEFKFTVPVFPPIGDKGLPLIRLNVIAADRTTHKEYSIYRQGSYTGMSLHD